METINRKNHSIRFKLVSIIRFLKSNPEMPLVAEYIETGETVKVFLNEFEQPVCRLSNGNILLLDERFDFEEFQINQNRIDNSPTHINRINPFQEAANELNDALRDKITEVQEKIHETTYQRLKIHKTNFYVSSNRVRFLGRREIAEAYYYAIIDSIDTKAQRVKNNRKNKGPFNVSSFGHIINDPHILNYVKIRLRDSGYRISYNKKSSDYYIKVRAFRFYRD